MTVRRVAASSSGPALASAALGVAAAAQAATMTINLTGSAHPALAQTGNLQLALVLLSLFAVLPLALVRSYPGAVAVIIAAANALSALALHSLTIAGALAQLAVLYVLGLGGSQLLAAALSVPFALLVLFGVAANSPRLASALTADLIILLASAGPLASWGGAAIRARRSAAEHRDSQLGITTALLQNTARGERARISRELHDVVAHHISMIAVHAETARLTRCPAARRPLRSATPRGLRREASPACREDSGREEGRPPAARPGRTKVVTRRARTAAGSADRQRLARRRSRRGLVATASSRKR
jgi:hypothetical protein